MPLADPPPMVAAEQQNDIIEVIASRTDMLKIDRRTYQVNDTPHSAQKDGIQLLRGLPAVTITPDDRILVLGAGTPRIHVDGRPYIGDASQYLRTLHGSDIERIEVITNPSAQFSSEGDGGVINLILRKTRTEGLSGNASLEESSYGFGLADTTLNYKRGDWTYQVKAGGNVGTMARRTYDVRRSVQPPGAATPTMNSEHGLYSYEGTVGRLSGKASYRLDSKTSLSAQLGGGGGHDIITDTVRYRAITPDFQPFSERRRMSSIGSFIMGDFTIDHKGIKEGEAINASLQFNANPNAHYITRARFSDGRHYRMDRSEPAKSIDVQADWKHPMATGQLLSLGSSWHVDTTSQSYSFTGDDRGMGSFGPDVDDAYDARSDTLAAYLSFQQKLGALTFAPGLRGEVNRRRISSPDLQDIVIRRANIFPSLHAGYKAGKRLQFGLSYSKRVDRAPLEYLRPYGAVQDIYSLFEGNPRLKDQNTDAYEASIQFRPGKIETNATLYLRRTHDLWSRSYTVNAAGTNIYSYVNAGDRWNRGAQFDLSFAVRPRVKATASVNLFDERVPVDVTGSRGTVRNFRYSTNGTLEWNGKERGAIPGDVAQFQWSYHGPSREYQISKPSWFDLSLSYTHNIERSLSLSGTFHYLSRTQERLIAPLVEELSSRQRTPELQLKLLKRL